MGTLGYKYILYDYMKSLLFKGGLSLSGLV